MKVLLLENVHPVAAEAFRRDGYDVEARSGSLSEGELVDALPGVSLLGIRSNTKVTRARPRRRQGPARRRVLLHRDEPGRPRRGAPPVAWRSSTRPFSNTRSVVELVLGELLSLARRLPEKTQRMHDGIWDKSAKGSHEVRGRTLGHRRLRQHRHPAVQRRRGDRYAGGVLRHRRPARARQRPAASARSTSCSRQSDVVSIHVDGRPGNAGLFGPEQFALMKPGSVFINASRGHGRRRRGAARPHPLRAPVGSGHRRVPHRAQGAGRPVRVAAARPGQRDPHAARRRVDPGGPGGDRVVRVDQAARVRGRRRDVPRR